MLSVLLGILKVIGLILLWILIIVFALLLIILLVPIRYRVDGVLQSEGRKDAAVKVTWLLHAVSFTLFIKDKGVSTLIRIFGIPLGNKKEEDGSGDSEDNDKKKKKKKKPKKKAKKKSGKKKKKRNRPESKAEEQKPEVKTESVKPEDKKTENVKQEEKKTREVKETVSQPAVSSKTASASSSGKSDPDQDQEVNDYGRDGVEAKVIAILEKILLKLSPVLHKIKYKISDVIHMFDPEAPLMQKLDFITNLRTKHAIFLVLGYVFRVLGHILPHKARGYIRFGFSDPSLTGRILAVTSATSAIHKNVLELRPDFENKVFDMDAGLKGRIYLGYIVFGAIVLVLKKDVLFVIKNFKKYF